jgi:hypothetical protein
MHTRVALLCLLPFAAHAARADEPSASARAAHADEPSGSAHAARAGEPRRFAQSAAYHYDRDLANDDDAQSARALSGTGAALTGVGAALGVIAVALGAVEAIEAAAAAPLGPRAVAAIGLGVGGAAMLAAGIPLLAVGRHRLRKLERADPRLSIAPLGAPRGPSGAAAQLSIRF